MSPAPIPLPLSGVDDEIRQSPSGRGGIHATIIYRQNRQIGWHYQRPNFPYRVRVPHDTTRGGWNKTAPASAPDPILVSTHPRQKRRRRSMGFSFWPPSVSAQSMYTPRGHDQINTLGPYRFLGAVRMVWHPATWAYL
jgi:hypothetical protein